MYVYIYIYIEYINIHICGQHVTPIAAVGMGKESNKDKLHSRDASQIIPSL